MAVGKKRLSKAARKAKRSGAAAEDEVEVVPQQTAASVVRRKAKRKAPAAVDVAPPQKAFAAPPVEAAAPPVPQRPKKKRRRAGADGEGATAAAAVAAPKAPKVPKAPAGGDGHWQPDDGPYAFDADPLDHCETDKQAYGHLVPVLRHLQRLLRGGQELRIWDPYFCNGAVKRNLKELGFPSVHNRNEDFYAVLASGKLPEHDVLMTSPPYSIDHIERCVRHCATEKCWCLLLPNWVHGKDFFKELERKNGLRVDFCVGPGATAYPYWFPKGAPRPDHVDQTGRTTPYKSSWHVHVPGKGAAERIYKALESEQKRGATWVLAKTVRGLKWKVKGKAKRGGGQ